MRCFANGLEHHVIEWGAGSPTALILHGFQDAAATWDDVAVSLARSEMRVLAPDMRGFGDGPWVPKGAYYHFPDYVADVAGLVTRLAGDGPLFLVGHSMGASIATYFTGAFPERVAKLVLVDGVGPPESRPDVAPARMRAWIATMEAVGDGLDNDPFDSMGEVEARLARYHPGLDRETLARHARQLVRAVDGGFAWKRDPLHATTSPALFFARSFEAFLRRVTCPVLHVSGGERGLHVPDEEQRLACVANLTRITIEGGHGLHWSKPRELAEALVAFWRS
ncbi:MAG TPA: alpha/beta hydrolase [Polyangiaceae bacterium]